MSNVQLVQSEKPAQTQIAKSFFQGSSSGGRFATELLLAAIGRGERISPAVFRPALDGLLNMRAGAVLRRDEFEEFDRVVVEETVIRLNGIADLISLGLVKPVSNAMGKTVYTWEDISDMEDAIVSLSGVDLSDNDAVNFGPTSIPFPVIQKGFYLDIRTLSASRNEGESLDTIQSRVCSRKCSELLEKHLFQGTPKFLGGLEAFGYTNHPNRNTLSYSVAPWDQAGATGSVILDDVLSGRQVLLDDGFNAPWGIYTPTNFMKKLDDEFTANYPLTIRSRLLDIEGISFIRVSDQIPTDEVVIVTLAADVVTLLQGEQIQTIMWDIQGGWRVTFKVFMIQQPLIRATQAGNSGILHLT